MFETICPALFLACELAVIGISGYFLFEETYDKTRLRRETKAVKIRHKKENSKEIAVYRYTVKGKHYFSTVINETEVPSPMNIRIKYDPDDPESNDMQTFAGGDPQHLLIAAGALVLELILIPASRTITKSSFFSFFNLAGLLLLAGCLFFLYRRKNKETK